MPSPQVPDRLKQVPDRLKEAPDRLKEAPAMVLRTIFAGIGQLLMAADKVRAQLQEQLGPPAQHRTAPGQAEAGSQQPAASNVTRLSDRQGPTAAKPATSKPAPAKPTAVTKPVPAASAAAAATAAKPAPVKRAPAKTAAKPALAKPAAARPAAAKPAVRRAPTTKPAAAKPAASAPVPPIAGYDSLSVASLRGRLRGLDPDGVRALLDYERATAHRDDVITMYEHRLARLAGETG